MHFKRRALARLKIARNKRIQRKSERLNNIIKDLKDKVKREDAFIDKCKEYNKNPNFIDSIKITFEPLDVSAKTVNGDIFLNEKLLNGNEDERMRYVIHEAIHVMQQENGKVNNNKEVDYLDDKNEQEAFQTQIDYMSDHNSSREIQEYIEKLLDHHDIKGEEREEKKDILLEDV